MRRDMWSSPSLRGAALSGTKGRDEAIPFAGSRPPVQPCEGLDLDNKLVCMQTMSAKGINLPPSLSRFFWEREGPGMGEGPCVADIHLQYLLAHNEFIAFRNPVRRQPTLPNPTL
jgi:hypothetical protein